MKNVLNLLAHLCILSFVFLHQQSELELVKMNTEEATANTITPATINLRPPDDNDSE